MKSEQSKAQHTGVCYVFFRLFPGLREPCELVRYVTLPDAEVSAAMEADANQWLAEYNARLNNARLNNAVFKINPRITGGPPKRREKRFARIARMAGWTDDRNSIGIADGCWATLRYPALIASDEQEAIAVCDGLNHRHRKHQHPDSPRFGWLPASAFPLAERLDIGASIREAQTGRLRAEPKPIASLAALSGANIYPLAEEAVDFYAAGKVTQPNGDNGKGRVDKKVDKKKLSSRGLTQPARACAKLFKARRKTDPKITMTAVIREYLGDHQGSFTSIQRSLSANPDDWKPTDKVDKTADNPV